MHIAVRIRNSVADSTGSLLPENRLLPLRPSLGNSCGSCRVYACIRVLHAPQLPPREGERGGTLPRIYLQAISSQVQGRFTVFLVDRSRLRRYSPSLRDILMPALVKRRMALRNGATRCHRVTLLR